MLPGRFTLGVGTGENLNEHVTGDRWPAPDERIEMLEEAIEVIRLLWQGGEQTHRGKHYTVDHATALHAARAAVPIAVAAAKPKAAELAGRLGDALSPPCRTRRPSRQYRDAGGKGPRYGQVRLCWAADEDEAKETAYRLWRHTGLGGTISQELPRPSDFDAVAESVTLEMAAEGVPCGPDPEPVLDSPERGSRPASTTSRSTRSAPTRTASSASGNRSCGQSSPDGRRRVASRYDEPLGHKASAAV